MEIQDRNLTCTDCGSSFIFTAGEQKFYQEKGFGHEPRRCKDCRSKRKGDGGSGSYGGAYSSGGGGRASAGPGRSYSGESGGDRQFYSATCSACGGPAKVSFQPSPDRPVFCRTCFQARQAERSYR